MRYIREMDFSNALYLRLFIKFAKWNKKNKFYLASWTSFSLVLKYIKNYSSLMMDYFRRIYSFFFNIIYICCCFLFDDFDFTQDLFLILGSSLIIHSIVLLHLITIFILINMNYVQVN